LSEYFLFIEVFSRTFLSGNFMVQFQVRKL